MWPPLGKPLARSAVSMPRGKAVTFGLDIRGTPTDYEFQRAGRPLLSTSCQSGRPDAGQVRMASLLLTYLHLAIASGAAPGGNQLRTLARFMHRYTRVS